MYAVHATPPGVCACGCANPRAPADSLRVLEPAAAGTPRQDPIRGTPPVACCPPATPRSPARLVRRVGPHRPAPRAPGRQPRNTLRQPGRVQRLGARGTSTAATSPALGRAPLLGCGSQATWAARASDGHSSPVSYSLRRGTLGNHRLWEPSTCSPSPGKRPVMQPFMASGAVGSWTFGSWSTLLDRRLQCAAGSMPCPPPFRCWSASHWPRSHALPPVQPHLIRRRRAGRVARWRPRPATGTWSGSGWRTTATTPLSDRRRLPTSTRWPANAAWPRTTTTSATPACRTTSVQPQASDTVPSRGSAATAAPLVAASPRRLASSARARRGRRTRSRCPRAATRPIPDSTRFGTTRRHISRRSAAVPPPTCPTRG